MNRFDLQPGQFVIAVPRMLAPTIQGHTRGGGAGLGGNGNPVLRVHNHR
ncbi:MAG: hypothetical protein JO015_00065 [Verrucomicrobia bacterium]|nr:hypothetical protein [Verrucomicrobiota bacterium]